MSAAANKLFVLDTNVILHDADCIRNFGSSDIALPITVLEELDKFKRGNENIHFQAREFLRRLDEMTGPILSKQGASRGPGLGNIRVVLGGALDAKFKAAFLQDTPDHRILNTALRVTEEISNRQVIVVSKDTNLRLKARSLGLTAEDYTADKLESVDTLYTGKRTIQGTPGETIDQFYADGGVDKSRLSEIESPIANENFILRNGSKSALATFVADRERYQRVEKRTLTGFLLATPNSPLLLMRY